MRICVPIAEDRGLESRACEHFGSAPAFLIVDTDSGICRTVVNANQHHEHGGCAPLASLRGEHIDAFVVGGIGAGALGKLMAAGIAVHAAGQGTVREMVDALLAGTLPLMRPDLACAHHGHGGHHPAGAH
jgi:predicted Fe-Mo cluster-binding NifX family protein